MKTFFRKVMLSFLAMFCGWVACNIAWWVGAVLAGRAVLPSAINQIDWIAAWKGSQFIASWTAIVVLAAWLAVFLPVDLCVSDDSNLRRPCAAALCGFLAASALVVWWYVFAVLTQLEHHSLLESLWWAMHKDALPYVLGTSATGMVAGWTRALMDKPSRNPMP